MMHGKLKCANILLYESANSPYHSIMMVYVMACTFPCFPYSYRNKAFFQSKLTFSKSYLNLCTDSI